MESELRVKLQILLENLDLNCKYFTGDEELCLRYGDNGIKDHAVLSGRIGLMTIRL